MRGSWHLSAAILATTALVYTLLSFWGIRSPDGELMYRTAESIARNGDLSVQPLERWKVFGVAPGKDGKSYAKYGPAVPLLSAPLAWLGGRLERAHVLRNAGPSFNVADGIADFATDRAPSRVEEHARRGVTAFFNLIVCALTVLAFFRLLSRFRLTRTATLAVTGAFALGTPMLAFSATFFCEPLIALCLLRAFDGLLAADPRVTKSADERPWRLLLPGLWLGMAVAAHVTAALWVPFLGVYAAVVVSRWQGATRARVGAFVWYAFGLAIFAGLLLWYNAARFDSVFATGRPDQDYRFTAPWVNLYALLFSWGKGVFVHCPVVVVGLIYWPLLVRKLGVAAWILIAAVSTRALLFSGFHDWHGGFGPAPRYLLPEIPLLLLPVGLFVDRLLAGGRRMMAVLIALCLCVSEQAWLAVGEVFSWGQRWRLQFKAAGRDILEADLLYRDFRFSPFNPDYLLDWKPGPALARVLEIDAMPLWLIVTTLLCSLLVAGIVASWRAERAHERIAGG